MACRASASRSRQVSRTLCQLHPALSRRCAAAVPVDGDGLPDRARAIITPGSKRQNSRTTVLKRATGIRPASVRTPSGRTPGPELRLTRDHVGPRLPPGRGTSDRIHQVHIHPSTRHMVRSRWRVPRRRGNSGHGDKELSRHLTGHRPPATARVRWIARTGTRRMKAGRAAGTAARVPRAGRRPGGRAGSRCRVAGPRVI